MSTRQATLWMFAVGALGGGLAMAASGESHWPWYVNRASGLAAFVGLSASVILGLLVSTRAAEPRLPRVLAFELHSFLSALSLSLIGVHAGALLFDGFLELSPAAVLLPFASPYERLWTGIGVIGAWGAALVTARFWGKKRIGHQAWRRFHYVSFGAYLLALMHGFAMGTDTGLPGVFWGYVASAAAVAGLLTYRIGMPGRKGGPAIARRAASVPAGRE